VVASGSKLTESFFSIYDSSYGMDSSCSRANSMEEFETELGWLLYLELSVFLGCHRGFTNFLKEPSCF
jgi:hypothetical protein